MNYKTLHARRQYIAGKIIVGIDPGRDRHQAVVVERRGVALAIFTFKVSYDGYRNRLWKRLQAVVPKSDHKDIVFAIETACNLWRTFSTIAAIRWCWSIH